MLETTLATKAWTPQTFLQVGTSLNNFKCKGKKTLLMKKMALKKRKMPPT